MPAGPLRQSPDTLHAGSVSEGCSHYYHLPPAQEGRGLGREWPLSSKEAACCLEFDLLWRSCCYWHSIWRETSHIWIPSWKLNLALEQVTIVSSNPSLLRPRAENVDCEWSKNKKVTTKYHMGGHEAEWARHGPLQEGVLPLILAPRSVWLADVLCWPSKCLSVGVDVRWLLIRWQ